MPKKTDELKKEEKEKDKSKKTLKNTEKISEKNSDEKSFHQIKNKKRFISMVITF